MNPKAKSITIKRIYEKPEAADGIRVLVDRIWPRGVSKEEAKLDYWCKDIAPSAELRGWFNHEPPKWSEFKKRYAAELKANANALHEVLAIVQAAKGSQVTLLFAARDTEHNNAVALRDYLIAHV